MNSRPIFADINLDSTRYVGSDAHEGVRVDYDAQAALKHRGNVVKLRPSQIAEHFIKLKDADKGTVERMDFSERRYLRRPYDTKSKNVLFMTSRQTEKSTTIANKLLIKTVSSPGKSSLFVTPSAMQTTVFSRTRIDEIIDVSPALKALTHSSFTMNLLEKRFITDYKLYLRYAFLSADRSRGLSVNDLYCDEIQDLLQDVMPVLEETVSHHKETTRVYSGTPKSFDNTIEAYWSKSSTMSEWAIPCERHGASAAGWHWNVLDVKNLGKKGPICSRCGGPLNPEHPAAQWVSMNPGAEFEGFRICRLMVPWFFKNPEKWQEILRAYERYPTAQFMNEVMALSYDSGTRPLSRFELMRACDNDYTMDEEAVAKMRENATLYAGIDWGCHDDQTRILTERGWVFFKDLENDDKVAQWDPTTRGMTFVIPTVRTVRDWDQPLQHYKTKGLDLMVTHTHRMHVRYPGATWTTEPAEKTAGRCVAEFVGHVGWEGEERETFTLPDRPVSSGYGGAGARTYRMDDWLEFMGYLVSEGGLCYSAAGRPNCIKMSQRESVNAETAARIKACMERLEVPYSEFPNPKTSDLNWTICGKQFWAWYQESFGSTGAEKRLPRWVFELSSRQLRILFDAMLDGDGTIDPRDNCTNGVYYSTSKGLCEDFQELCIRLGMRCLVREHKPAAGNRKTRYRALFSEGRDYTVKPTAGSMELVPYSGKVYCCAVPSGYIVTERNGAVSYQGNTGEKCYTVFSVGGYVRQDNNFQIVYSRRFDGPLVEPEPQMAEINRLIHKFGIKYIGADYGMGFHPNKQLTTLYGPKRVHQFQYASRAPAKMAYKPQLFRYLLYRTPLMSDIFSAIKNMKVRFPAWHVYKEPYGTDILSIRSEYSDTMKMLKYDKPRAIPDDAFHSVLYTVLVSMLDRKRPDIIAPLQDKGNVNHRQDYYEALALETLSNENTY